VGHPTRQSPGLPAERRNPVRHQRCRLGMRRDADECDMGKQLAPSRVRWVMRRWRGGMLRRCAEGSKSRNAAKTHFLFTFARGNCQLCRVPPDMVLWHQCKLARVAAHPGIGVPCRNTSGKWGFGGGKCAGRRSKGENVMLPVVFGKCGVFRRHRFGVAQNCCDRTCGTSFDRPHRGAPEAYFGPGKSSCFAGDWGQKRKMVKPHRLRYGHCLATSFAAALAPIDARPYFRASPMRIIVRRIFSHAHIAWTCMRSCRSGAETRRGPTFS
jgi:hypothetical protein